MARGARGMLEKQRPKTRLRSTWCLKQRNALMIHVSDGNETSDTQWLWRCAAVLCGIARSRVRCPGLTHQRTSVKLEGDAKLEFVRGGRKCRRSSWTQMSNDTWDREAGSSMKETEWCPRVENANTRRVPGFRRQACGRSVDPVRPH